MVSEEGWGFLHSLEGFPANLKASGKFLSVAQNGNSSGWATVLAVLWLHTNAKNMQCEWELLERKAVSWIQMHAGRSPSLRPHVLNSVGR